MSKPRFRSLTPKEREARERLRQAAPALLDMLRQVTEHPDWPTLEKARLFLAKVEGRELPGHARPLSVE